jgi:hypothetical protein
MKWDVTVVKGDALRKKLLPLVSVAGSSPTARQVVELNENLRGVLRQNKFEELVGDTVGQGDQQEQVGGK